MFMIRRASKKQLYRYKPGVIFWEAPPRRTVAQDLTILALRGLFALALTAAVVCVVLIPDQDLHAWTRFLAGK